MGKTVPEVLDTQDRGHSFSNTDRPRLVNNIFIFFYNRTKGMRKTRTAVIMARFATNCTISSEQIVIKTEVIQSEERGFTERFLFK